MPETPPNASSAPRQDAWPAWAGWLVAGAVCTAGLLLALWPTLSSGFAKIQADPGDTRHLNYVLESGHRWLFRWPGASLWNPPFFFPERNVGGFTETLLGSLPVYSLWRLLSAEPDTAFQLWMLSVLALDYAAAYVWLRKAFRASRPASAVGAFLFAFGSSRLNQLNHQHLLPQFFTPLCLLALSAWWEAPVGSRRAAGFLAAAAGAFVGQTYCCFQLGWFLGFALLCAAVLGLAMPSLRPELWRHLRGNPAVLSAVCGVALAALVPLALGHLRAAESVGMRHFWDVDEMLPRLQSWFDLGPDNWLYGWMAKARPFRELPMEWEHRVGLGFVTTGAVIYASIRAPRGSALRWMLGTMLVIALSCSLYRWRFTPWRLFFEVIPGAASIRAVSRVGLLMLLPGAAGVALLVDRLAAGPHPWLAAALALVCMAEQGRAQAAYDKREARAWSDAVASRLQPQCKAFYFSPPATGRLACEAQLDAMWASLQTGVPTLNGYSSNFPRQWDLLDNAIGSEADESRLRGALTRWSDAHGLADDTVCWLRPDTASLAWSASR